MEVIYLIFFFVTRGAAFVDQVPQASMEQCEENGAALQKLYREIKFKCIPGLAEGSGTPISTEELMNRYSFKDSTYGLDVTPIAHEKAGCSFPKQPGSMHLIHRFEAGLSPSRRNSVLAQLFRGIHALTGALTRGQRHPHIYPRAYAVRGR